jgi:ABC-type arginine transport system permease subunit
MPFVRIGLSALILVCAVTTLALASPSTASAAACGQAVVADWSDGRLDAEYPAACYRAALRRLPEDLRVYGTAGTDIHRALMSAVSRSSAASATASDATATAGPFPWWLVVAASSGVVVGLIALVSLRSARLRKRQ